MSHDLIFHIVEKDLFRPSIKDGEYIPESFEGHGFIPCSTGYQINEIINNNYGNKRHLLLLVIDTKRVEVPIKYEEDSRLGQKFPHVYGPLNTVAILDKIELEPDEEGEFDLEFSSR